MAPRLDIAIFLSALLGSTTVLALSLPIGDHSSKEGPILPVSSNDTAPDYSPFAFDPGKLIESQPFGTSANNVPATFTPSTQAVQIALLGVLASNTPDRSWAFLSVNNSPPEVFRLGEPIVDTAVLKEVFSTHVVIEYPDRLEEVYLITSEDISGLQVTRQQASTTPIVDTNTGLAALAKLAPSNPTYGQPAEELDNSVDGLIARYREALRVNPTSVRMRLGIEQTDEGYVVQGVTAPVMLTAGFKPGDIITKINGMIVADVENEVELFDGVVSSSIAQVEIVRNGETIVKSFPMP